MIKLTQMTHSVTFVFEELFKSFKFEFVQK